MNLSVEKVMGFAVNSSRLSDPLTGSVGHGQVASPLFEMKADPQVFALVPNRTEP